MSYAWRISNYEDLKGFGGLIAEGRWHPLGQRVVYLSEHPALALLEVMIHLEIDHEDLPDSFKLLKVKIPDELNLDNDVQLPKNWQDDKFVTQKLGLDWLAEANTPLLRVPSVILPNSFNYLLNPIHPAAQKIEISFLLHSA